MCWALLPLNLTINSIFDNTRMTWKAGGSRQLNTEGTMKCFPGTSYIFGRIPGPITTLPETDMAPWKRRWSWTRKPSFLGVNSLGRLTFQYFSDVFRSCLWDLGPGSAFFGKRCATGTSILYRPSRPPFTAPCLLWKSLYSTCSRGKKLCWIEVLGETEANLTNFWKGPIKLS